MTSILTVGAAQLGPVQRAESRRQVVEWLIGLLRQAHARGCRLVVCPETDGDELIVAECDLDMGRRFKETVFNFAAHRRIEHYGLITQQTGALPPE